MVTHGIIIRAIPQKVRSVYETSHAARYPQGQIQYLEGFHREMLVVERTPDHAGKFIAVKQANTQAGVRFSGCAYFDSIQQAVEALLTEEQPAPQPLMLSRQK